MHTRPSGNTARRRGTLVGVGREPQAPAPVLLWRAPQQQNTGSGVCQGFYVCQGLCECQGFCVCQGFYVCQGFCVWTAAMPAHWEPFPTRPSAKEVHPYIMA